MQSEVDSLKQRISELEAEKVELETKNAELLKHVTEESTKREAENAELKARIAKLEQIAEKILSLKIESRNWNRNRRRLLLINRSHLLQKIFHHLSRTILMRGKNIAQPEFSTEPETSTTSLPQDIIHDSAEILDFVETMHKERISISTQSTPEPLDSKTVKKLWNQNQNKSQDKTSQSHKKKGTENIAQAGPAAQELIDPTRRSRRQRNSGRIPRSNNEW
ncbi:8310_t:CDS:2 [Paraglomus brasilianum]|uniref:8310_t:CDS:1 n=1 Tax=Paraglomus brasilianum TaxID=144538 RepID=A0A9N8VJC2_9GLOM|nr:8310_t:CDS:2 [Paraglomus brasilianum]